MRRWMVTACALFVALASTTLALSAAGGDDSLLPNEKHFLDKLSGKTSKGVKGGSAFNMVAVGQNDIGGRGFNGDVFVHNGLAYVGRWGFFERQHPGFCPQDGGIAVFDVSDPANPKQVADLPGSGASVEDVEAYTASYGALAGHEIAVVGTQYCVGPRTDPAAAGHRGLDLWDVTTPNAPVKLGTYDAGCCNRGVHEFEVGDRADLGKTLVYASVPFAERADPDSPTGVRDLAGKGEARIIDITEPRNPVELSTFGIKKDLGLDPAAGQGCFALSFGHGMNISDDGTTLFVSYWDAGFISLDVTNPSAPSFLGRWTYAPNEDGDGHSTSYDGARKLLFGADEDFCKGGPAVPGWGYLRVFDASNPGALKQIGSYRTPNSLGPADPGAGDYVIHNPLVVGTDVYLSWYTDGIRVVDTRNPANPVEVANFVPPAAQNPIKPAQRGTLTNTTQVWGVAVDESTGLVYASDMNSGLWIIERTD